MQCMCGDIASTKTVVWNACAAELDFYQCRSCDMVSDGVLYIEGVEVAADAGSVAHARQAFNTLTKSKAGQLVEHARLERDKESHIDEPITLENGQAAFNF